MSQRTTRKIILVGHRGAAGLAPENTLLAFRRGIEEGMDAIELDIHQSRDGALVVMHDADVARTTDGRGAIGAMTLPELKRLNAAARSSAPAAHEEIPTLDQVLDLARERQVDVYLEIKGPPGGRYPGIEAQAVDATRRAGLMDHVLVISFDLATLQSVKAAAPSLPVGWLVSRATVPLEARASARALAEMARKAGVDNLGVSRDYLSADLVQAAHDLGLTVGVWTVDDPAEMRRFADWGVDAVTSNRPDLLVATLGK